MRWWESGQRSIEDEQAWFRAGGFSFELDRDLFDRAGVVAFVGQLRYGDRRCSARVVYPSGYSAGQNPAVVASGLPFSRHKGPDGTLCLDHPAGGETTAMTGADAVEAAEELWRLSIEDPEGLAAAEADAPDPVIEQYSYEPGSAITLVDVDVSGHDQGSFRLGLTQPEPLRGGLAGLAAGAHGEQPLSVSEYNARFAGGVTALGFWRRVAEPPRGRTPEDVYAWVLAQHGDLVQRSVALAAVERQVYRRANLPAIAALVLSDEGPGRGDFHDEWIVINMPVGAAPRLARAYSIRESEHWLRQPQLRGLGAKRIGMLGAGALGSQIGVAIGRAGIGDVFVVDPDIVSPGNRVRHDADLGDIGYPKAQATVARLMRVNPYITAGGIGIRFGAAGGAEPAAHLAAEEQVEEAFSDRHMIINASAHVPTGYLISSIADQRRQKVLHVMVSSGAWSGRILLQRHGQSGCLECLARHQEAPVDGSPIIPQWTEDPEHPEVVDLGCGQVSFTGPNFEIAETAAAAARLAVAALLEGDGYPAADSDLITLRFRTETSARTEIEYTSMPRHPRCQSCSGG